MVPNLILWQILKRLSKSELVKIGGTTLYTSVLQARISWKLAPWFLFIAFIFVIPSFKWLAILIIPVLAAAYFLSTLKSMRKASLWSPSIFLALGLYFLATTGLRNPIALFIISYSTAILFNRYGWWILNHIAKQYPNILAMAGASSSPSNYSEHDGVADAEVVEISDVDTTLQPSKRIQND